MKKLFLITLTAVMLLNLVACGDSTKSSSATTATVATTTSETTTSTEDTVVATTTATSDAVTLIDVTTEAGLSMKLPSDMTLQDVKGTNVYVSPDKKNMAIFALVADNGAPLSEQKEETYVNHYKANYTDVVTKRFENNIRINEKDALIIEVSLITPAGNAITMTQVIVTDGKKAYNVTFNYAGDNSSFLAQNVQACIDSITIPD